MQTVSMAALEKDGGVPARGLHGEAYRGHIFWDELFIFPFLNLSIPELTRELLMYRYRRLEEARQLAHEAGYRGAMFPWQSGSTGRDESQYVHLNPESGRWNPDYTNRQRHVNSAIAYNVWNYYQSTEDGEFLSFYGAEMMLEIARFWASIAVYQPNRDRYEIRNVVGPDEFHTQYPNSDEIGIHNNAYTNIMASWVIRHAIRVLELLPNTRRKELIEGLQISDTEFQLWDEVSRKLFVPFQGQGIISQFEGYETLKELNREVYRQKYSDLQRVDRILEAEGDSSNCYQISKQADVLMLFYLLSSDELKKTLNYMGYDFNPKWIRANIDYYSKRVSHGSTLSRVIYSWVLARSDRENSWKLFQAALRSDVSDIQGGTTSEGIHLGAMAGTVDLVQRCYSGIQVRNDVIWFNPSLPSELSCVSIRIRYRGRWLMVHVTQQKLRVCLEESRADGLRLGFENKVYPIRPGETREFHLMNS
jgi:trehalose/maltose hydrolase-like predicted phosphorylase